MARQVGSVSLLATMAGILAVCLAAPSAVFGQSGTATYWDSASGMGALWGTSTNWSPNSTGIGGTGVVPTSTFDAFFNGSSEYGNTIVQLAAAGAAEGLYFNNTGTTLLEGATATETLTIGADGITVDSIAGAVTLGSTTTANLMPIIVSGIQTWTNNSTTNSLNVISAVSGSSPSVLSIGGAGNTNINGIISGTVALKTVGTGTLTLTGVNTYTGTTSVTSGTFALLNTSVTGSYKPFNANTITVSSGATFAALAGLGAINLGSSLQSTKLTLSSGSIFSMVDGQIGQLDFSSTGTPLTLQGATLNFDVGIPGSDWLRVSKAVSTSGTNTINLTPAGSVLPVSGTYNLITATSGLTGTYQFSNASQTENLTVGGKTYTATLANSTAAESVTIVQQGPTLTWTGLGGSGPGTYQAAWDTSSTNNWADNSNAAATYTDGSNVAFTDFIPGSSGATLVSNTNITIQPSGVTPAAVSFNDSAGGYVIEALSGPIQGATTTLTISGGAGQTILNSNTYGGGTWIGGIFQSPTNVVFGTSTTVVGGAITSGPFGTGTINLVGGSLQDNFTGGGSGIFTLANNIAISANTSIYSTTNATIVFDGTNLTTPATIALTNNPVLTLGSILIINDVVTGVGQNLTVISSSNHQDLILNGANTYTGVTTLTDVAPAQPVIVSVGILGLGGSPSGIGESSNAAANLVLSPGTLQYIGSGGTTDRLFTLGASSSSGDTGGTLDASGTGPIVWSNPGAIVGNNHALTLTGTNTGANTLTPILTGTSTLTKSGVGTWVLAGSNTFTGNTTIGGGILAVTGAGQLYNESGVNDASSIITVNSGGTLEVDRWDVGAAAAGELYAAGAGSFGNLASTSARLVINGGAIMYSGNTNFHNTNSSDTRGFTIGASGATLDAATAGQTWSINFSSTNTIVSSSGGLLTLSGPGNGVIDQVIPGTGGLTMSGSGAWTLTAANQFTGPTTLSAGTLVMGNSNALSTSAVTLTSPTNGLQFAASLGSANLGSLAGSGNIALQDNAVSPAPIALTVGGNNSSTIYSGSLGGPGSLTMSSTTGAVIFTLSGANSYSGTTSVTKGTLALASTASLGNTAISVANGATFAPQAGSGTIRAGSTGSAGAGATLNLASGAVFSMTDGAVGTFQLQQGSGFGTPALTLGGAMLNFDLNGSVSAFQLPAVDLLAASGAASVNGTNTINLTLITPGVLNPGGPINLISATSGLTGTFQFSNASTTENMTVGGVSYSLTLGNTPTAETLTILSNGPTLTWTGLANGTGAAASTWDAGTTNNWATSSNSASPFATGDTVIFNDTNAVTGAPVTNGTINIQSGGVSPTAVTFDNSNINYTISPTSGPIKGAATLFKSGSALLSIQNLNIYARGTTLTAGTLRFTQGTNLSSGSILNGPVGSGPLSLSGGTLDNGNPGSVTLANNIMITADSTLISSASGPLVFDGAGLTTPATVVLSNNPTLTVNNTTTINDVISGSGQNLTLVGNGTLIFGNANTYTGTTTITSGTLQLGNGTNNGSVAGSITDDSALVITTTGSPSNATIIGGSGSVTVNGAGTLTLSGGNSFQGGLIINGSSNLVLVLSGANTYSGGTLIQNGTLRAGAANTVPTTGSVTFGGLGLANGTLDLNGYGLTVGGLFVASGAAGNAANQIVTNSNTSGNGSTATLTYNGTSPNSFAGTLKDGSGGNMLALTMAGGNLTLSGTNTYTGATAVNGGTLQVASPGSLAGAVTVSSSATLSGSGTIGGLVTVNSGGIMAPSGIAGAATTTTLQGGLTLANGAVLDFNLSNLPDGTGSPSSSNDHVAMIGNLSLLGQGTLNINATSGGLGVGTYQLVDYTGTLFGDATNWSIGTGGQSQFTYKFDTSIAGQFDLTVSLGGSSGAWISNGNQLYGNGPNWDSGNRPDGVGQTATFGTGVANPIKIDGVYTLGSLNFTSGSAYNLESVTNSGNGLTLNNGASADAQVNVADGGAEDSLATQVNLASGTGNTTFTIQLGSLLTINSGSVSNVGLAGSNQGITLAGGGTLELAVANTYTGPTKINSGTLQIDPGASIKSTAITVGMGGTLLLAGTTNALPAAANITTKGSGLATDGAVTLTGGTTESIGSITGDANTNGDGAQVYAGNTTVGDVSGPASLTATQILQNTLTINAGSTVTIAPSAGGSGVVAAASPASATPSAASADDSDALSAIQDAIAAGSITSATGQRLENRLAAIERLAASDPGFDVSLLEDRVLAALPSPSVWSSSGTSSLIDSGLLAVDVIASASSSDLASSSTASAFDFGGNLAAVPEPSSLLLATMAGIGILVAVRRRKT